MERLTSFITVVEEVLLQYGDTPIRHYIILIMITNYDCDVDNECDYVYDSLMEKLENNSWSRHDSHTVRTTTN